jgi:hypothetical protein
MSAMDITLINLLPCNSQINIAATHILGYPTSRIGKICVISSIISVIVQMISITFAIVTAAHNRSYSLGLEYVIYILITTYLLIENIIMIMLLYNIVPVKWIWIQKYLHLYELHGDIQAVEAIEHKTTLQTFNNPELIDDNMISSSFHKL